MYTRAKQLEATAEVDVPPRIWAELVSAAARMSQQLFPAQSVSLLVTTPERIRALNREFRGEDQPTDVLSFPNGHDGSAGDVALCWAVAVRQAAEHDHSALAEAAALVAHGLLHLAGHDHHTDAAARDMDRLTRALCNSVGIEVSDFGH